MVMSPAGVIPGSIREEPCGVGTIHPSESEPRKRRPACAWAAQKLAEPDGYSGWSAVWMELVHCDAGRSSIVPRPGRPRPAPAGRPWRWRMALIGRTAS